MSLQELRNSPGQDPGPDYSKAVQTLDRLGAAFQTLSVFLLSAPSQDLLDQVCQPELLDQWPGTPSPYRAQGTAHLVASNAWQETQAQVKQDYNSLFVGPEAMLAPPYESVHRSQERLIFEQETFVVRAAYAEFDLAAPHLNQEPDDHIGLELAFLGTLAERALDAIEENNLTALDTILAATSSFLHQHLLRWGPDFFTLVQEHATTEFYRGVSALGLGVLEDAARSFDL